MWHLLKSHDDMNIRAFQAAVMQHLSVYFFSLLTFLEADDVG